MTIKLHLGCGKNYLDGWFNVDINKSIKADAYIKLGEDNIPLSDNSVTEVYMSHSLEHIEHFWPFIKELYRVCCNGAKVHILVPHCTSCADSPQHFTKWAACSFCVFDENEINNGETGQNYNAFVCKIDKIRLHWLSHGVSIGKKNWWIGAAFELLANHFGFRWMQFAERWPFGWSEIEYKLTVIK